MQTRTIFSTEFARWKNMGFTKNRWQKRKMSLLLQMLRRVGDESRAINNTRPSELNITSPGKSNRPTLYAHRRREGGEGRTREKIRIKETRWRIIARKVVVVVVVEKARERTRSWRSHSIFTVPLARCERPATRYLPSPSRYSPRRVGLVSSPTQPLRKRSAIFAPSEICRPLLFLSVSAYLRSSTPCAKRPGSRDGRSVISLGESTPSPFLEGLTTVRWAIGSER